VNAYGFAAMRRSRMLRPMPPHKLLRAVGLLHRWGLTPAAAYGVGAAYSPNRTAIVDDFGMLTFAEVERRTNALANALRAHGVAEGDSVAIMCRNHRGFIEATVACSKLSASVQYLDTAFRPSRIAAVLAGSAPAALIYDEEFAELMPPSGGRCRRIVACSGEGPRCTSEPLLEELIEAGEVSELTPARRSSCVAVLTAGPTGSAQHVEREVSCSLVLPASPLTPIPLRRGQTTVLAAPMCHPWGFMHLTLGLRLGSTLVLRRRFDPVETMREVSVHRASALVLLPEMLQEIVWTGADAPAEQDTSSLRLVAVNGSSLPQQLALPALQRFGDILYDLHSSSVVKLDGRSFGVERRRLRRPSRARLAHGERRAGFDGHVRRPV
jgi:acyl-CoA synthetase (AMP-forming)/AMP-acid ligase II